MEKTFDLDSISLGVTSLIEKPRGPRSRKEKLEERAKEKSTAPTSPADRPWNAVAENITMKHAAAPDELVVTDRKPTATSEPTSYVNEVRYGKRKIKPTLTAKTKKKSFIITHQQEADLYAIATMKQIRFFHPWFRSEIIDVYLKQPENQKLIEQFRKRFPEDYEKYLEWDND